MDGCAGTWVCATSLGVVLYISSEGHRVRAFSLVIFVYESYHQLERAPIETTFPAFTAAKMMGPRLGRFDIEGDPPMGSPTNAVIGLFMLWWGWLAFNAGSTFGEN